MMKPLLIVVFTACLAAGCTEGTESSETIKLPPQDSAIDIDHRVPPDSVPVTDSARQQVIY